MVALVVILVLLVVAGLIAAGRSYKRLAAAANVMARDPAALQPRLQQTVVGPRSSWANARVGGHLAPMPPDRKGAAWRQEAPAVRCHERPDELAIPGEPVGRTLREQGEPTRLVPGRGRPWV